MPVTSRTGLLPCRKKSVDQEIKGRRIFEMPNLVVPAPFTLRPFAGIYNPFPYGCSILCNHPTDFEAKAIVQKAKDAWASEGRSLIDIEELEALKKQRKSDARNVVISESERCGAVTENFFHGSCDRSESRPATPAPTLISVGTKTLPNLKARRCLTPDPTSFIPTKEKTFLVLDLRRSHTLYSARLLRPAKTFNSKTLSCSEFFTPPHQNVSLGDEKRKKAARKKSTASSGTASSLKTQNSRDSDFKSYVQAQNSASTSPSRSSLVLDQDRENTKSLRSCGESSSEDEKTMRRRGKKKRGKKSGKRGSKEGDKEFKGIPDPGETQISAMGTDSQNGSSRRSSSGEDMSSKDREEASASANVPEPLLAPDGGEEGSFLHVDILRQLQRQLDQEVVDSELNITRKKALEEALKYKARFKCSQGEEMKMLIKEVEVVSSDSEAWLSMPRVFSRRSARFELPMDSRLLRELTPFEYVQNYVFPSQARLVLYNHVFNLLKEEPEDEETERILAGKNVEKGLGKIMGRSLTEMEIHHFQELIQWKDKAFLDFRTFTGISAACERLLGSSFCSKNLNQEEDPRHEIERVDFESLEAKLKRVRPSEKLAKLLRFIRDS